MVRISLELVNAIDMMLMCIAFRDGYVHEGQWIEVIWRCPC